MTVDLTKRVSLKVEKLTRRFGFRTVFKELEFDCGFGDSVCITGPNGSGKSTLLKIIAGLLPPTSGEITFSVNDKPADAEAVHQYVRTVSPELNFYDELTGCENLDFLCRISGKSISQDEIEDSLDNIGLSERGDDLFGAYSSGMKQRLKLAVALISNPPVLLLDEPSLNLDDNGREIVHRVMEQQTHQGILIYATNEEDEFRFGGKIVRLG